MAPRSQEFFIPGPLPGLNELLDWAKRQSVTVSRKGRRWNVYADHKQYWEEMMVVCMRNAKMQPVQHPVTIHYVWYEPNRRRDPSNVAAGKKLIEDALIRAGILKGDGWRDIVEISDHFLIDKKKPGVLVTLVAQHFQ